MTTNELEHEIKSRINKIMPELNMSQIRFCKGNDNSPEGTYIYFQNGRYHYIFTEKGRIRVHEELSSVSDVLWKVLNIVLDDISIDYAMKNREEGKDFRRPLFKKEIELFSKFGDEFEKRKINEINEILAENPFYDEQ